MEQFLKLLSENGRAGQSEDLSRLLFYMDGMNRQLDAVRQELQTVKVQLAQAQDTPQKTVLQRQFGQLCVEKRRRNAGLHIGRLHRSHRYARGELYLHL